MEIVLIIICVIALFFSVEYIYEKIWFKHLDIDIEYIHKYVTSGEKCPLVICVSNSGGIVIPFIVVKYVIWRNGKIYDYRKERFSLRGMQRVRREHILTYEQRGMYEIKEVTVSSFGLFLKKEYTAGRKIYQCVTVYPDCADVRNIQVPVKNMIGDYNSGTRLMENMLYYQDVREYQDTDTFSRINWNATAVMGQMMSNVYDDKRQRELAIVLELPDRYVPDSKQLAEMEIKIACGLYKIIAENGKMPSLVCNAVDFMTHLQVIIKAGAIKVHTATVLESMARLDEENLLGEGWEKLIEDKNLVYITEAGSYHEDFINKDTEMYSHGRKILWILVDRENRVVVK